MGRVEEVVVKGGGRGRGGGRSSGQQRPEPAGLFRLNDNALRNQLVFTAGEVEYIKPED